MNVSFMKMYRLIRPINNNLPVTDFERVLIEKEFFEDLEKVFDEIADVVLHCPLFNSTKKDND